MAEGLLSLRRYFKKIAGGIPWGERGVFGGGYASDYSSLIEYVTIATTGNAINFGNLTEARYYLAACSGN